MLRTPAPQRASRWRRLGLVTVIVLALASNTVAAPSALAAPNPAPTTANDPAPSPVPSDPAPSPAPKTTPTSARTIIPAPVQGGVSPDAAKPVAPDASANSASITGTVKGTSGEALQNFNVRAFDAKTGKEVGNVSVSDAQGKFAVTVLPPGTYKLSFLRNSSGSRLYPGEQWWNKKFTKDTATTITITRDGQTITGINQVMSKWESITGTVKGTSGEALQNFHVRAFDAKTGKEVGNVSVSDAQGKFAVTVLPPGTYKLSFLRNSSGSRLYPGEQWWNKKFTKDTATTITITRDGQTITGINQVMSKWESITGTVKGAAATPTALKNVTVSVLNAAGTTVATAKTDTNGAFTVTQLPKGTYKVSFAPTSSTQGGTSGQASYPATQWWNQRNTFGTATPVSVGAAGSAPSTMAMTMLHFFQTTPTPTISGSVGTGKVLTATAGTWSPAATIAYQWKRGCEVIPGATKSTYKQVAADAGKAITVTVRASKSYFRTETRTSTHVGGTSGTFGCVGKPTISGIEQVGAKLTADPGEWRPVPSYAYQWFRNGVAISGATKSTYTAVAADASKTLTVRVTGTRSGYTKQSATSGPTGVIASGG